MKIDCIPLEYDSFDYENKNYIRIVAKTSTNKKVCIIDSYDPSFWVILKKGVTKVEAEKLAKDIQKITIVGNTRTSCIEKTVITKKFFLGKKVLAIQVFVTNHKDLQKVASEIGKDDRIEARREYDIPLITKYIKEKQCNPLEQYTVTGSLLTPEAFGGVANALDIDTFIHVESVSPAKKPVSFTPKVLAYDIETSSTDIGKGEIYMVAVYGEHTKKVFTWKKTKKAKEYVVFCDDEKDMIEQFSSFVVGENPDIISGYFSDGFDLPYLFSRAKKLKAKFSLGLDGKPPEFSRGRIPSGKCSGIVHVDIFRFISAVFAQYLESETLSLGDVGQELVGSTKEDFDFSKLDNMSDSDWQSFASYNLQDTKVTYDLVMKLWPDMVEFSKIIKEPLFDITRDRMATHVENYLLHNLGRFDEIAEKRPGRDEIARRRSLPAFEGAFVFEPTPGLYDNVVFFDFTSMYASVIVTYNLSKSTYNGDDSFVKEQGFFPTLLSEIIEKRKFFKKEYGKNKNNMARARSNAYKLLANAAYGYQAYFGGRYYCREAAAATATLARKNIKEAIEKIKKEGYEVIYSDTDSIAFLQGKKKKKDVLAMLSSINKKLPGIMELDLEDFFTRGLFVSKRTTVAGAKKKYALINEDGKLRIRGFETVRRDWCSLARELQSKIIRVILEDGDEKRALEALEKTVEDITNRAVSKEEVKNRTQLKKSLDGYAARGPHVVAAEKMKEKGIKISPGMLIEYYIAEKKQKTKTIGDKVALMSDDEPYDIEYYLDNQIIPATENIFEVFGIDISHVIKQKNQMSLDSF